MVKNLPAKQETQVRSLGQEDPLEKEMASHSSILAWGIPWREEPGGLQSMGSPRVRHDLVTKHEQNTTEKALYGTGRKHFMDLGVSHLKLGLEIRGRFAA